MRWYHSALHGGRHHLFKGSAFVVTAIVFVLTFVLAPKLINRGLDFNLDLVKMVGKFIEARMPKGGDAFEAFSRFFNLERILLFSEAVAVVKLIMLAVGATFRATLEEIAHDMESAPIETQTGDTAMNVPTIDRPRAGWGRFILLALLYLAFTIFAAAVLFRGFRISEMFSSDGRPFGVGIVDTVVLAGIGFVGFLIQHRLSEAYGIGRVADIVVSAPMVAIIVVAGLLWAGFPIVKPVLMWTSALVGYPFESTASEYKVGGALIFAFYALIDIGRDWFGIGRLLSFGHATRVGSVQQAPHEPLELQSESGNPFMRTQGPLLVEVDEVWLKLPSGRMFKMPMTDRLEGRVAWNLGNRQIGATAAAVPTPTQQPQGGGNDGNNA